MNDGVHITEMLIAARQDLLELNDVTTVEMAPAFRARSHVRRAAAAGLVGLARMIDREAARSAGQLDGRTA